jgi:hypothetical protein
MWIARINLDLGISRSDFNVIAKKFKRLGVDEYKGTTHRYLVREMYMNDCHKYLDRIICMVSQAVNLGAQIVQLPATSIIVSDKKLCLQDYVSNFPSKSCVVAGFINATRLGTKGDDREGSVAITNKKVYGSFYNMSACVGYIGDIPTVTAVSSTVKNICKYKNDWIRYYASKNKHILVFDLGHEQYTGRYKSSLYFVHKYLKKHYKINPIVILSQWRYTKNAGAYNWIVSGKKLNCIRLNESIGALKNIKDEIDLIKINGRLNKL